MKSTLVGGVALLVAAALPAHAQDHAPGEQGSSNVHVLGHIPLGRSFSGSDIEMEQELARPYVYTSVMLQTGTNIISAKDSPGGFHNIYMYKHSDGRTLLVTTNGNPGARVFDMEKYLAGDAQQ